MGVAKNTVGVFPPKWTVNIRENLFLIDDLGGKPTIFGNTQKKHAQNIKSHLLGPSHHH